MVRSLLACLLLCVSIVVLAHEALKESFPLGRYSQKLENWIKPADPQYKSRLMSVALQRKKMNQFYEHFMGALSPWSAYHVNRMLSYGGTLDVVRFQKAQLATFSNQDKPANKIGYGANLRPYSLSWISRMADNMNLSQFGKVNYRPGNRAIAVDNLHARLLPTEEAHFYNPKLPGEGYPFDNLQMSSIWVGTPVYILGESKDHRWLLVLTPDFVVWVKSAGIARVNSDFVTRWQGQTQKKWVAITRTKVPLRDEAGRYLYEGYVGAVFPAEDEKIWLPVRNLRGGAAIKYAKINADSMAVVPLPATPENFSRLMKTLLGRPYGWGNLHFYNDCSSELKNLFTPLGIWLPRQSSDQSKIGKVVDLSASSKAERLAYLLEKGRPFMTIAYVGGHVLLYVGRYPSVEEKGWMAMSYQSVWGLASKSGGKRSVVNRSAFLPLLFEYPEDTSLVSHISKPTFKLIYLDVW